MNKLPTFADLDNVRSSIGYLRSAQQQLRSAGVRRAAILTAQALKAAESAERTLASQLMPTKPKED